MFDQAEFTEETFQNLEVKGTLNSGILFEECRFENCSFDNVVFKNTHFENCVFSGCSLILPDMANTTLDGVFFDDCKIVGCNFSLINNFNTALKFDRSKLVTCSFVNLDLRKTSFSDAIIDDTLFRDCILSDSNFQNAQFKMTVFALNDLRKANFNNASGFQIDPCENKLKGAVFSSFSALELLKSFDIRII